MTFFDLLLLILLGGFVLYGLWFGLMHAIGALVGSFAGAFFAGLFFSPIGSFLASIWGHELAMKGFAFVLIFFVFNRLIGFGFYVLDRAYQVLARMPYLHSLDKVLGGLVGLLDGVLVIGIALFIFARYPLGAWMEQSLIASEFAPWFMYSSRVLQYLLPEVVRQVRGIL